MRKGNWLFINGCKCKNFYGQNVINASVCSGILLREAVIILQRDPTTSAVWILKNPDAI
jgi:hypothetical protein